MPDAACTRFLQEILPRLGLRWAGFRKPRGQVCKRIRRRMAMLGVQSFEAYRSHLDARPAEWDVLDRLCRVTISRFRRDHGLWRQLEERLPHLVHTLCDEQLPVLRAWSAGCASGEEPYTLSLLWHLAEPASPGAASSTAALSQRARLWVLATDADPQMLARAHRATYPQGSLREVPDPWRAAAFDSASDGACRLQPRFRRPVRFVANDLRVAMPHGPFHVILCRNLAFTYFDASLQQRIATDLAARLAPGGVLGVGAHETLPMASEIGLTFAGDALYERTDNVPRCTASET